MNSKELIARLERFRLEHRITQTELGEMLGVKFVTVSRWLNGHHMPNKIQTYHIEKLLAQKGKKK
jgi:transcriptional regulator with XRE-family HTH domain